MKLKITEIEATAEELRASNSMAEGLSAILRKAFNPYSSIVVDDEDDAEEVND